MRTGLLGVAVLLLACSSSSQPAEGGVDASADVFEWTDLDQTPGPSMQDMYL